MRRNHSKNHPRNDFSEELHRKFRKAPKECRSAGYARKRIRRLLYSERIRCSPDNTELLKRDVIRTVSKYVAVEEEKVSVTITREPAVIRVELPVRRDTRNKG